MITYVTADEIHGITSKNYESSEEGAAKFLVNKRWVSDATELAAAGWKVDNSAFLPNFWACRWSRHSNTFFQVASGPEL